jgi:hypothetical protein
MRFDAKTFLNKSVGEDFLETLAKADLYKPTANVAVDLEDIRIGLKVVPRVIMSLLIRELPPMKFGDVKTITLFLGSNAVLNVNKHDTDVYSGTIVDNGAVLVKFQYRPLPGVGLVIMSAFELYDMESNSSPAPNCAPPFIPQAEVNVQKLIDERLALHHLVGQVVEHKMMEREAIQKLFMAKIKEHMELAAQHEKLKSDIANVRDIQHSDPVSKKDPYMRGMANGLEVAHSVASNKEPKFIDAPKKEEPLKEALSMSEKKPKKVSPLKGFLDKKKLKKNEFHFEVLKSDIACPDCKQDLIKNSAYIGCICMGSSDNKVYIKKSESGVTVRLGRGWDSENIEMLLDILRKKNG